jgi:5-dehydro-2-deoxygluconokinase
VSKRFDVVTMGRSSIDLYSQDVGAAFEDITGFAAYVGGCPTNIAVGARRLGLKTALLTAVGEDKVGDFLLRFLEKERVDTAAIPRKADKRTSAVVLGIEPPDRFPLVYYREGCADIALDVEDVDRAPVDECRALVISGTGLSRMPSLAATLHAAARAKAAGAEVWLDLDFRLDQWGDARAYSAVTMAALSLVDVVLGTEEEILAASGLGQAKITHQQISAPEVTGDLDAAIAAVLARGPSALVEKRGERGAAVHLSGGEVVQAEPCPVEVLNVLGAGDAFAAGTLFGRLRGLGWSDAARVGNAIGAYVVTQPGCANFMPNLDEARAFASSRGGLPEGL